MREPSNKLLASEREKIEEHLNLSKMAFKHVKYLLKCKCFVVRTGLILEGCSLFSISNRIIGLVCNLGLIIRSISDN